jgi:hypothetical protein
MNRDDRKVCRHMVLIAIFVALAGAAAAPARWFLALLLLLNAEIVEQLAHAGAGIL